MIGRGKLVQIEHSSSGTEFSQGHVLACARLLGVCREATIVAIAGWSKRGMVPDGESVERRFSRQEQSGCWVDTHSPE
jgi:hypothetical protein